MPTNNKTDACLRTERGALVFWAPDQQPRRYSSRVQIIDVFSLQVATGYSRDPQGRLLLEAQTSVAAGRSWTLAKAAQLIRTDARPHRWVALQMDKRAWGLFWAGGGCSAAVSSLLIGSVMPRPSPFSCRPHRKPCCS